MNPVNKYTLVLISVILYGCWNFMQKLAVQHIHPLHILIVNCCMGTLLLPIYLMASSIKISQPFNIVGGLWAALAFLCAVMASFAFAFSIRNSEVGTMAVLASASPVITVLLASIFLHESITIMKLIGIALVMSGVFILGH